MIFIGILVGFDVALLTIMGIGKWKEKKSREESKRLTAQWGKLNELSEEELDEAFEKYIAHDPSVRTCDDLEKAWTRAVDKAFEKHIKALNGEVKKDEKKCFVE